MAKFSQIYSRPGFKPGTEFELTTPKGVKSFIFLGQSIRWVLNRPTTYILAGDLETGARKALKLDTIKKYPAKVRPHQGRAVNNNHNGKQ